MPFHTKKFVICQLLEHGGLRRLGHCSGARDYSVNGAGAEFKVTDCV